MRPPAEARIDVPWGPRDVGFGVVVVIGLAAAIIGLLTLFYRGDEGAPFGAVIMGTLVLELTMLGAALALTLRAEAPTSILFGPLRYNTVRNFLWGAVAFAGSIAVGAIYITIASQISDDLAPTPLPVDVPESGLRWLVFVTVVLVGPFAEEVFFRGFVFAGLLRRFSLATGVVGSAALFAVAHIDLAVIGPAFLSGCVYALVYWRSGSLWPVILAHTAQNAVAFAFAMA